MWGFLAPVLKAIAPAVVGKLMGGSSNNNTGGNTVAGSTYNPPSADQAALEALALKRVQQSQPLYESVMRMAMGRLPIAYQGGGTNMSAGTARTLGNPSPTQAHGETAGPDQSVPDFAQQIVQSYRDKSQQSDANMPGSMPSGSAFVPGMTFPHFVDIMNARTGEIRRGVPDDQIPDGWMRIGTPRPMASNGGAV